MTPLRVHAVSGGKDSTAMVLRLREVEPCDDDVYLITPTGDELPEMVAHWERLECMLGTKLTRVTHYTLASLIEKFEALPSWRMRWCTRMLKIEPCLAWLKANNEGRDVVLSVGLRADEPERKGIYSNDVDTRFPLREWGWGIDDVRRYLSKRKVAVPARTDCARCYDQRLGEWHTLWNDYPAIFADAEAQEKRYGHTFRSPTKGGTWPAGLAEMRAEFERGRVPPGHRLQLPLFEDDEEEACRICKM